MSSRLFVGFAEGIAGNVEEKWPTSGQQAANKRPKSGQKQSGSNIVSDECSMGGLTTEWGLSLPGRAYASWWFYRKPPAGFFEKTALLSHFSVYTRPAHSPLAGNGNLSDLITHLVSTVFPMAGTTC
ncbi:MAG: hypothetical protein SPI30_00075 [Prevotella sp.]|nr:hypothetical protein [Prevotella sp.]